MNHFDCKLSQTQQTFTCSKLTIETLEQSVKVNNKFEHNSYLYCFYCKLWTGKCRLGMKWCAKNWFDLTTKLIYCSSNRKTIFVVHDFEHQLFWWPFWGYCAYLFHANSCLPHQILALYKKSAAQLHQFEFRLLKFTVQFDNISRFSMYHIFSLL